MPDTTVHLPVHGEEEITHPHTHPVEEEERLNGLGLEELTALIRKEPAYVDYHGATTCPSCTKQSQPNRHSCCEVCGGAYCHSCQALITYEEDNGRTMQICNYCRKLRSTAIAITLMASCPECMKWVNAKKVQLLELAKDRKIHARTHHLAINRDMVISSSIMDIVNETEQALQNNEPSLEALAEDGDSSSSMWAHKANESMDHSFHMDNYASPLAPHQEQGEGESSQAATKKEEDDVDGSIDSHEEHIDWMREMIEQYYPSAVKEEIKPSIYELDKGWRERRGQALKNGLEKLAEAVEKEEIKLPQSEKHELGLPTEQEIELFKNMVLCHGLFWPFDTQDEVRGFCPYTEAHELWRKERNVEELLGCTKCNEGYCMTQEETVAHMSRMGLGQHTLSVSLCKSTHAS